MLRTQYWTSKTSVCTQSFCLSHTTGTQIRQWMQWVLWLVTSEVNNWPLCLPHIQRQIVVLSPLCQPLSFSTALSLLMMRPTTVVSSAKLMWFGVCVATQLWVGKASRRRLGAQPTRECGGRDGCVITAVWMLLLVQRVSRTEYDSETKNNSVNE